MSREKQQQSLSTLAIHAGADRTQSYHSLTQPITQTSTFFFPNSDQLLDLKTGKITRHEYGRYGNPTLDAVESTFSALEGAESAVVSSSGMASVTSSLLALLKAGDHLVFTKQTYRRSLQFCEEVLTRFGVSVTMVPTVDAKEIGDAFTPQTRLVFLETPTNPYLYIADIPRIAALTKKAGALLVVDATFATPFNLRPLELGADLVVHSATKYLSGHNDLLGGVVVGPAALVNQIRTLQGLTGPVLDAHAAFMMLRGLKTFPLRMAQQNQSALAIARFLESHPKIQRVFYPGLPSHPDHVLAVELLSGFGGVVSFEYDGDFDGTRHFVDRLVLPQNAPSFGGVDSLVEQVALMSYYEYGERGRYGITDNLIRLSVGLEAEADLIADLEQALAG